MSWVTTFHFLPRKNYESCRQTNIFLSTVLLYQSDVSYLHLTHYRPSLHTQHIGHRYRGPWTVGNTSQFFGIRLFDWIDCSLHFKNDVDVDVDVLSTGIT